MEQMGQLRAAAPALFVRLLSWTPKPLGKQTSSLRQTPAPVSVVLCDVLPNTSSSTNDPSRVPPQAGRHSGVAGV